MRGGHAFKKQKEIIIALSGSLDVVVDDRKKVEKFTLNRSYYGLYIPNRLWRHMENFSTNSCVIIITNTDFDENDYIRNYNNFKNF